MDTVKDLVIRAREQARVEEPHADPCLYVRQYVDLFEQYGPPTKRIWVRLDSPEDGEQPTLWT
jgi:hypothetical protein